MNGTIRILQQVGNSSGDLVEVVITPQPNQVLGFDENNKLVARTIDEWIAATP